MIYIKNPSRLDFMINKGRETESSYIMLMKTAMEVKSLQPFSKHKKLHKCYQFNRQSNTVHVIIWQVLLITFALSNDTWAIDAHVCMSTFSLFFSLSLYSLKHGFPVFKYIYLTVTT